MKNETLFSMLEPRTRVLGSHIENEETYIIIKGTGQFQVDGMLFVLLHQAKEPCVQVNQSSFTSVFKARKIP